MNVKNVNFQEILGIPIPERYFGSQDGSKNAARSAQDGSQTLLGSIFVVLETRLKFGLVWGAILVDFGLPFWHPSIFRAFPPEHLWRS